MEGQGQGRSRRTTTRQDRFLVLLSRRNRMSTARAMEIDVRRLPMFTCPTRLLGIDSMMMMVREPDDLTEAQFSLRNTVYFAREHQNWQLRHWRPVLFTDESRFTVSTNDRRARVWRRQGERYADCNIVEVDRYGGGSVMVWTRISLYVCVS